MQKINVWNSIESIILILGLWTPFIEWRHDSTMSPTLVITDHEWNHKPNSCAGGGDMRRRHKTWWRHAATWKPGQTAGACTLLEQLHVVVLQHNVAVHVLKMRIHNNVTVRSSCSLLSARHGCSTRTVVRYSTPRVLRQHPHEALLAVPAGNSLNLLSV